MLEQLHIFARLPLIEDASLLDLETKAVLIAAAIVPLLIMELDADSPEDGEAVRGFAFQMLNHLCKRFWTDPKIASAEYAGFLDDSENKEMIRREAKNLLTLCTQLTAIVNGERPPGFALNLN
ncbi:hypothetical protein LCGC14_2105780 [marine sediment metagenome]|uniref:Uncharacterized protein n=1 Tax=marine sediment metagenome TaxID=412755 RepID=A0A0F9H4Z7_9ZZZZ